MPIKIYQSIKKSYRQPTIDDSVYTDEPMGGFHYITVGNFAIALEALQDFVKSPYPSLTTHMPCSPIMGWCLMSRGLK